MFNTLPRIHTQLLNCIKEYFQILHLPCNNRFVLNHVKLVRSHLHCRGSLGGSFPFASLLHYYSNSGKSNPQLLPIISSDTPHRSGIFHGSLLLKQILLSLPKIIIHTPLTPTKSFLILILLTKVTLRNIPLHYSIISYHEIHVVETYFSPSSLSLAGPQSLLGLVQSFIQQ